MTQDSVYSLRAAVSLRVSEAACLMTFILGALGILAWSLEPGPLSMAPATGVGLMSASVALCLRRPGRATHAGWIFLLCGLVTLLGLLGLIREGAGWDFPLLSTMIESSVSLVCLGISIWLLDYRTRRGYRPHQLFAVLCALISLLVLIGYVFDLDILRGTETGLYPDRMAVHTAVGFGLLSIAIFGMRPYFGALEIVLADTAGSAMVRWLVALLLFLPVGLGLAMRVGQNLGILSPAMGGAILVFLILTAFAGALWLAATKLVREEQIRKRVEEELRTEAGYMRLLSRVTALANQSDSFESAVRLCLNEIGNGSSLVLGHAFLKDPAEEEFRSTGIWYRRDRGEYDEFVRESEAALSPDALCVVNDVVRTRRSVWVRDIEEIAGVARMRRARQVGLNMMIALPVIVRNEVNAVLEFYGTSSAGFDPRLIDILTDVAAQLGRTIERDRAKEWARRAIRAREEAIATVSHDLKSPLTAIRTSGELLELRTHGPDECSDYEKFIRKMCGTIRSASDRMVHLIQDQLDFAKIEAGRFIVEKHRTPVGDLFLELEKQYLIELSKRSVRIRFDAKDESMMVLCDRVQILRALSNLIDNALKVSPSGGVIKVDVGRVESITEFSVSDQGPGISPEDQTHLFQRYWQGEKKKSTGTGLGLAITKGVVEAHGGQIGVESIPGRGSRFYFTIPG